MKYQIFTTVVTVIMTLSSLIIDLEPAQANPSNLLSNNKQSQNQNRNQTKSTRVNLRPGVTLYLPGSMEKMPNGTLASSDRRTGVFYIAFW